MNSQKVEDNDLVRQSLANKKLRDELAALRLANEMPNGADSAVTRDEEKLSAHAKIETCQNGDHDDEHGEAFRSDENGLSSQNDVVVELASSHQSQPSAPISMKLKPELTNKSRTNSFESAKDESMICSSMDVEEHRLATVDEDHVRFKHNSLLLGLVNQEKIHFRTKLI